MSMAKGVVIAGGAALLALVFLHSKSANAAPKFPAGWTPPPGASTVVLPTSPVGFPIGRTSWQVAGDAGGQQPGRFDLYQNTNAADTDYVVMFTNTTTGGRAPMAIGPSANAKLLAQAVVSGQVQ